MDFKYMLIKDQLNKLIHTILDIYDANSILLYTSNETADNVIGTTTFNSKTLIPIEEAKILAEARKSINVFAITVNGFRINRALIEKATEEMEDRFQIIAELDTVFNHSKDVYVAYVATHFNKGPLGELTISIGGDCFRHDQQSFADIIFRTRDLAESMLRKAVTVFPDIPALHGGKKGEWIVIDAAGQKIDYLSEKAIVALGTYVIPKGILFLNQYKELLAKQKDIIEKFPESNFMRPDTGSPDVISGPNWGSMCRVWHRRNIDLSFFTCMPPHFNGPLSPSSKPTGYGAATTAVQLAQHYFNISRQEVYKKRFLIEALGGVSFYTIESLINQGVPPENIVGFDPSLDACGRAGGTFNIRTHTLTNGEFYHSVLPGLSPFDIWINNGLGDNVGAKEIYQLINNGVKVFCGAANNFLKVSQQEESLKQIFSVDAISWPDEATSGGGWTLAVMDGYQRCQQKTSNNAEAERRILNIIINRNQNLVTEVFNLISNRDNGQSVGSNLWNGVINIIKNRANNSLNQTVPKKDIASKANVTSWKLD